jgi:5-methylthioribose kinase
VTFVLTADGAPAWLVEHGLLDPATPCETVELSGGVSATVVAVRAPGTALVVKQALPRLRVADEWLAPPRRAATEASAMRLCADLTPGSVPAVLASVPSDYTVVLELVEDRSNWQAEVAEGRPHAHAGTWAGKTLGTWHAKTSSRPDLEAAFDDHEAFDQLRLDPFHATVMERRPEFAPLIAPRLEELRVARRCLVHGDYAMKNMLVSGGGCSVLDFEVAHYGHPVFDLGFFLSFVVLSAVRWPEVEAGMREVADRFLKAYEEQAGPDFAGTPTDVTSHTACLVLARTDGKSIALFLDDKSRARAREVGTAMLRHPDRGLWEWA